jgi:hypothetical protein
VRGKGEQERGDGVGSRQGRRQQLTRSKQRGGGSRSRQRKGIDNSRAASLVEVHRRCRFQKRLACSSSGGGGVQ